VTITRDGSGPRDAARLPGSSSVQGHYGGRRCPGPEGQSGAVGSATTGPADARRRSVLAATSPPTERTPPPSSIRMGYPVSARHGEDPPLNARPWQDRPGEGGAATGHPHHSLSVCWSSPPRGCVDRSGGPATASARRAGSPCHCSSSFPPGPLGRSGRRAARSLGEEGNDEDETCIRPRTQDAQVADRLWTGQGGGVPMPRAKREQGNTDHRRPWARAPSGGPDHAFEPATRV